MSVELTQTKGIDPTDNQSYRITPNFPQRFTEWNDGLAIAGRPENRQDDVLLDRPTMEMGNRTEIGYDADGVSPPSQSHSIGGKSFYERLDSHNRDAWWEYRTDSTTSKNVDDGFKSYLLLAFSHEVGLNSFQSQIALRRFMRLDLKRGTGRSESNAFLICSLVANEAAERYGEDKVYHPQRSSDNNDAEFQGLEQSLIERFSAVTNSSLTKLYNKLSQGSPPTRCPSKWKGVVKHNSDVARNSSFVAQQYDPRTEDE